MGGVHCIVLLNHDLEVLHCSVSSIAMINFNSIMNIYNNIANKTRVLYNYNISYNVYRSVIIYN